MCRLVKVFVVFVLVLMFGFVFLMVVELEDVVVKVGVVEIIEVDIVFVV